MVVHSYGSICSSRTGNVRKTILVFEFQVCVEMVHSILFFI